MPNVVDLPPVTDDDDKERRSIHNQTQSAENLSHEEKVLYLQGLGIRLNEDTIPPNIFMDFVKLLYEFRSVLRPVWRT